VDRANNTGTMSVAKARPVARSDQALIQIKIDPKYDEYGNGLCSGLSGDYRMMASIAAFFAAGMRPRTPLAKAIVLVLVIKLIGIAGMRIFLFPDHDRPVVDAAAMARLIGVSPSLP